MNIDPFALSQRIDAAWQAHLRSIGVDVEAFPTYDQPCPGGGTVKMRCYPDDLKKAFHQWLKRVDLAGLLSGGQKEG